MPHFFFLARFLHDFFFFLIFVLIHKKKNFCSIIIHQRKQTARKKKKKVITAVPAPVVPAGIASTCPGQCWQLCPQCSRPLNIYYLWFRYEFLKFLRIVLQDEIVECA